MPTNNEERKVVVNSLDELGEVSVGTQSIANLLVLLYDRGRWKDEPSETN
jgi:hypothetical protein